MQLEKINHEDYDSFKTTVLSDRFEDDVEMGTWAVSSEVLKTAAAASCVVLAAHNIKTGTGLLGHFSNIAETPAAVYNDQQAFEAALAAVEQLGDPLQTSLWIGGGTPYVVKGVDTVAVDRGRAEQQAQKVMDKLHIPEKQLDISWSEPARVIDVRLKAMTATTASSM
jgi:hypothetical protein